MANRWRNGGKKNKKEIKSLGVNANENNAKSCKQSVKLM